MRIIGIKKKSGGIRKIYIPSKREKRELRKLILFIPQPMYLLRDAHGFLPGRSPVSGAMVHVENYGPGAVMVSMDLKDFFANVHWEQVEKYMGPKKEEIRVNCFPDGGAQQGLLTSPALANLAGIDIDKGIRKLAMSQSLTYSRYADDLSLSFREVPSCGIKKIIELVEEIVRRCGHEPNTKKTRVQYAAAGRWECCGVMIDADGLHVSRRQRRMLRALKHIAGAAAATAGLDKRILRRAAGLEEWARLKPPLSVYLTPQGREVEVWF